MSEPPFTSHTKFIPAILHHNKGIEIYFSRHRNLTTPKEEYKHILACAETLQRQKKGIEKYFNRIKNLTGVINA